MPPTGPRAVLSKVPPWSYFTGSAVFHYLGPAFAVLLFSRLAPLGAAALRIWSAVLVLALWRRPWRILARLDADGRRTVIAWGAVLAVMNVYFYLAIARMARSTYALLVALLPATATVIGIVMLRQFPSPAELAGVGLVVLAVALYRELPAAPHEEGATPLQEGKTECVT